MSVQLHPRVKPFRIIPEGDYGLRYSTMPDDALPVDQQLLESKDLSRLCLVTLCTAISSGCSLSAIKKYLQFYNNDEDDFKAMMHIVTPALYYAIGRNSAEIVATLLEYGVDPTGKGTEFKIPPLAFAIIYGHRETLDTTEIVKILLAHGVNPRTIPENMWTNYLEKPQVAPPKSTKSIDSSSKWCGNSQRAHLAPALKLSQRYFLNRASQIPVITNRDKELCKLHRISGLLKVPYHLIGQASAARIVQEEVIAHIGVNVDESEPLVMAFVGPPGHGKTELARQMGDLLGVDHKVVDCAQMKRDTEIFGSKQGYERSTEGSPLNNFLSDQSGKRSVVFLDEFDKTSEEVRNSLLKLCEEGLYQNRRNNQDVDCRKTIWILASNLGDAAVCKFYERDLQHKTDKEKAAADLTPLITELRSLFSQNFSTFFESRIDTVVPFFPFSVGEQATVTHKFILKLEGALNEKIDLRPEVKRFFAHTILSLLDDGKICTHMAEHGYRASSGARGLKREVRKVEKQALKAYNAIEYPVAEDLNSGDYERLEVRLMPRENNMNEIGVFRKLEEVSGPTNDQ